MLGSDVWGRSIFGGDIGGGLGAGLGLGMEGGDLDGLAGVHAGEVDAGLALWGGGAVRLIGGGLGASVQQVLGVGSGGLVLGVVSGVLVLGGDLDVLSGLGLTGADDAALCVCPALEGGRAPVPGAVTQMQGGDGAAWSSGPRTVGGLVVGGIRGLGGVIGQGLTGIAHHAIAATLVGSHGILGDTAHDCSTASCLT
jgi:hypothetical protein